jgi:hypothetical protein
MQLEAFMLPQQLFAILKEEIEGGHFIFQGFEPTARPGFVVPPPKADLAAEYVRGRYNTAYISTRGLPKHPQDWDFIDRESDWLIELTGGRMQAKKLELATLRPMSKKSKVSNQFSALRKRLIQTCEAGVKLNGHPYPKILWQPGAEKFELWQDLDTRDIRAQVIK